MANSAGYAAAITSDTTRTSERRPTRPVMGLLRRAGRPFFDLERGIPCPTPATVGQSWWLARPGAKEALLSATF
jgi:hypothetical protein